MADIVVCRVCLADNIRMHAIASTPYHEMFEKLSTIKPLTGEGLPDTICYLCASQLQKFCRFFKLSQITEKLLTKLRQDGNQLSHATIASLQRRNMHTYSMSPVQCMTVSEDFDGDDVEVETLPEENIKEEASDFDKNESVFEDGIENESNCSCTNLSVDDLKCDPEGANTMTPTYQDSDMSHILYQPKFTAKSFIVNQPSSRVNQPSSIVNHPRFKVNQPRSEVNQPQLTARSSIVNQSKSAQSFLFKCTSESNQTTPLTPKNESSELSITKSSVESLKSHFNHTEDTQLDIRLKRKAINGKTCEWCQKTFSTNVILKAHVIRVHFKVKPFECDICKKTFPRKDELKNHTKVHTRDTPFTCPVCSEKFAKKFTLETHLRIHTRKQLFSCDLCSMKFMYKSLLETHARSHTGDKPFGCKKCSKRFSNKYNLDTHMKMHAGTIFACKACDKSFKCKSSLKLHVKTYSEKESLNKDCIRKHVDSAPYDFECDLCGKLLNSKECLSKHMVKHTGLKCDLCNRTFKKKCRLRTHVMSHMGLKQLLMKTRLTQLLKICTGIEYTRNTSSIVNQSKTAESSLAKCTSEINQKTQLTPKNESSELSITKSLAESSKSHFNHTEDTQLDIKLKRKAIKGKYCEWCQKTFSTNSILRGHVVRIHFKVKPFECDICKKKFSRKEELVKHAKVHTRDEPFTCPVCNEKFAKYFTLLTHVRVHTRQPLFSCDLCNKKFMYKSTLETHAMTHSAEKPFGCETCSQRFSNKYNLYTHMKAHTDEKYACNVCDSSFIYKSRLKLHLKTHDQKDNIKKDCIRKPGVECDLCGKVLKSKDCLSKHMVKHTGLICDVCNRTFKKKHNLRMHVMSHMGLKPHACGACGKKFQMKYSLTQHLKVCTGKEYTRIRSFTCDVCNHTCNLKHNLKLHMILHTGEKPYICDRCGKQFAYKTNLTKHTVTHTGEQFPCEHCDKIFNSKSYLKEHCRVHTGELFPCDLCERKFTRKSKLEIHRKIHTGERPFACNKCNKRFITKSKLKSHVTLCLRRLRSVQ